MVTCVTAQTNATAKPALMVGQEMACLDCVIVPSSATQGGSENSVIITPPQMPAVWAKVMEREFRKLAQEEAQGTLTAQKAARLEELNRWRNRLLNPQSSEDILKQIKRDRLLEKMETLIREYVQFQEATDQKRASA